MDSEWRLVSQDFQAWGRDWIGPVILVNSCQPWISFNLCSPTSQITNLYHSMYSRAPSIIRHWYIIISSETGKSPILSKSIYSSHYRPILVLHLSNGVIKVPWVSNLHCCNFWLMIMVLCLTEWYVFAHEVCVCVCMCAWQKPKGLLMVKHQWYL